LSALHNNKKLAAGGIHTIKSMIIAQRNNDINWAQLNAGRRDINRTALGSASLRQIEE
jgi:hypothetical protein